MAFNLEQLKSDILVQLGSESVPIELGDEGLKVVVRRTKEQFEKYKPVILHDNYYATHGIFVRELPVEATGAKRVEILNYVSQAITAGVAIESQLLAGAPVMYGTGNTFMEIDYLHIRRQWIKAVSRELGADPDYAFVRDPVTGRYNVYTFCTGDVYVDVEYTAPYKDDLTDIPEYWRKWVADYALAEAMLIVGRVRRKFDKIPVAGTSIRLDGDPMIAEATAKQKELIDMMERSRCDLFPSWA